MCPEGCSSQDPGHDFWGHSVLQPLGLLIGNHEVDRCQPWWSLVRWWRVGTLRNSFYAEIRLAQAESRVGGEHLHGRTVQHGIWGIKLVKASMNTSKCLGIGRRCSGMMRRLSVRHDAGRLSAWTSKSSVWGRRGSTWMVMVTSWYHVQSWAGNRTMSIWRWRNQRRLENMCIIFIELSKFIQGEGRDKS